MGELRCELYLPRRRDEVFPFFADARNLEKITPGWLRFSIVTPQPIEMRVGARIQYRLRIRGFPMQWESEITAWDPPHRFVDEQRRGPYRRWRHEHLFQTDGPGTLVVDNVDYAAPGGRLVENFLVRPDVEAIFGFRQKVLSEMFKP